MVWDIGDIDTISASCNVMFSFSFFPQTFGHNLVSLTSKTALQLIYFNWVLTDFNGKWSRMGVIMHRPPSSLSLLSQNVTLQVRMVIGLAVVQTPDHHTYRQSFLERS
jgi:hypothetical protein